MDSTSDDVEWTINDRRFMKHEAVNYKIKSDRLKQLNKKTSCFQDRYASNAKELKKLKLSTSAGLEKFPYLKNVRDYFGDSFSKTDNTVKCQGQNEKVITKNNPLQTKETITANPEKFCNVSAVSNTSYFSQFHTSNNYKAVDLDPLCLKRKRSFLQPRSKSFTSTAKDTKDAGKKTKFTNYFESPEFLGMMSSVKRCMGILGNIKPNNEDTTDPETLSYLEKSCEQMSECSVDTENFICMGIFNSVKPRNNVDAKSNKTSYLGNICEKMSEYSADTEELILTTGSKSISTILEDDLLTDDSKSFVTARSLLSLQAVEFDFSDLGRFGQETETSQSLKTSSYGEEAEEKVSLSTTSFTSTISVIERKFENSLYNLVLEKFSEESAFNLMAAIPFNDLPDVEDWPVIRNDKHDHKDRKHDQNDKKHDQKDKKHDQNDNKYHQNDNKYDQNDNKYDQNDSNSTSTADVKLTQTQPFYKITSSSFPSPLTKPNFPVKHEEIEDASTPNYEPEPSHATATYSGLIETEKSAIIKPLSNDQSTQTEYEFSYMWTCNKGVQTLTSSVLAADEFVQDNGDDEGLIKQEFGKFVTQQTTLRESTMLVGLLIIYGKVSH